MNILQLLAVIGFCTSICSFALFITAAFNIDKKETGPYKNLSDKDTEQKAFAVCHIVVVIFNFAALVLFAVCICNKCDPNATKILLALLIIAGLQGLMATSLCIWITIQFYPGDRLGQLICIYAALVFTDCSFVCSVPMFFQQWKTVRLKKLTDKNNRQEKVPPDENPPDENPPDENPPEENPPAENPPDENPRESNQDRRQNDKTVYVNENEPRRKTTKRKVRRKTRTTKTTT